MKNFKKMKDQELYEYCVLVGARARKWKNRFVSMLPEIARRRLHKKHGFATLVEFAAKVGGVGKKTVEAVFQVEKYIGDKPALKEIMPKVGVNKVRVVATIATKENQAELAKRAETMSKSALEVFAREIRNQSSMFDADNDNENSQIPPGRRRENLSFAVDEDVALKLRIFKQKLEKEKKEAIDWNEVMKVLIEKADKKCVKKPKKMAKKAHGKTTRYITVNKKQELEEKYHGGCAVPTCNKPSTVIHHQDRFALKKSHENIVPLCGDHHEIAHHGLMKNEKYTSEKKEIDQKVIKIRHQALAKQIDL